MSRVLVIGDTHFPAVHPGYLDFVKEIKKKHRCDTIVHIGDVIDHHTVSFHKKHPDNTGAVAEYQQAFTHIQEWKKAFPKMQICIGNHDDRVARLNADVGIPAFYLKPWNELYGTNQWVWDSGFVIDNVFYTHCTGASSAYPALNAAKSRSTSVVMGHHHSVAGIHWIVGPNTAYFGMDVGCGVDRHHMSMQYGANYIKKPVISCGVVINGHPYLELMPL